MVNLSRSLGNDAGIMGRQPLQELISCSPPGSQEQLLNGVENLIREELNDKQIRYTCLYSELVARRAATIYKTIGPRFGKLVNRAAEQSYALSHSAIHQLETEGKLTLTIDSNRFSITPGDIEIRTENREGLAVASEDNLAMAFNIMLTEPLLQEGWAREFIHRV